MRWGSILKLRIRSLFQRMQVEQELDEELQYHLDREIEKHIAAGMTRNDARFAALRAMGAIEPRKEECRDARGWNMMDNFWNDVRFSLRQLRRDRAFSIVAVTILSLGFAASIAIFAFLDAALMKPLPYRDPSRLLSVFEKIRTCPLCNLSHPDYHDWKRMNTTLAELDAYQLRGFTMTLATGGVTSVRGARVTSGFFRTLGVPVPLGRDFRSGEDKPGAPRTVILSHAAWQQHFASDPAIAGKKVTLNRIPYDVIGVLPSNFQFAPTRAAEFWTAMQPEGDCDNRRSCHSIYAIGRLKEDASPEVARANLVSIAAELERQYPDSNRGQGADVQLLTETIVGPVRPILLLLMAGAGMLLLIAITNVSGLLLVRTEARQREVAIRSALGASASRLMGQFATESAILISLALLLGCEGAHLTMRLLVRLISDDMRLRLPFVASLDWSPRVLLFAAAVAAVSALLFAVAPSLRLRSGSAGAWPLATRGGTGTVWRTFGARLAVFELAAALVLLVGAGLLSKSLHHLLTVPLGFRPERLLSVDIAAPAAVYGEDAKASALTRRIVSQTGVLPGVTSAAVLTNGALVSHNGNTTWLWLDGHQDPSEKIDLPQRDITPSYFTTIGARLLSGRFFTEADDLSRPSVAIVNQAFARQHFPHDNPVGKKVGTRTNPNIEIVGVVEDVRQGQLNAAIPPVLYRPFHQSTDTYLTLLIRTEVDERSVAPALRRMLREIDPEIVVRPELAVAELIERTPAAYMQRSAAWVVGAFAGLALVLALVGLYGVISYSVSQRTREIGVRIALGAQRAQVYGMVMREAATLTVLGVGLGFVCAAIASTWIRSLLFGVSPWDGATLAVVAAGVAIASQLASFLPARRAASVDPVEALRAE